jgi:DNA-binding NtrC family response regulator
MKEFDKLIGKSPEFCTVIRSAQLVAAADVTVLITGQSGTGKELLANAIHLASRRKTKPFITVNCAALPENLAESELFGHRKGSFTGALTDKIGLIQTGNKGTIFFDEIGELPLAVQAKLLRFLENGECQGIGQQKPDKVDVRVIAATNRNLYQEVKAGAFRKDLYYRLHVVPLEMPPLCKRYGDLPLLLEHFTNELASRHGLKPPIYPPETMSVLKSYAWHGNVRELRNFCERMVALYSGRQILLEFLPQEIKGEKMVFNEQLFILPDGGVNLYDLEAQFIRQALFRCNGNRSQAAKLLGFTRNTLLYRMSKYAIE